MGFWSSLAGGVASLIPGVGPFIGPIIGGVAGAVSAGKTGSGTSDSAGLVDPTIMDAFNRSRTSPNKQAEQYFSGIVGGDRQATEEQLQPEVSTVLGQYDTAMKTAANLNPRGGGRTSAVADVPYLKAAAYGKALAGARSGAAEKLGAMGEQDAQREAGIGSTLLGTKMQDKNLQFQKEKYQADALGELGSGIGSSFVDLLNKKKKKSGGTPGGGGLTPDILNSPLIIKNLTNGSEDGF